MMEHMEAVCMNASTLPDAQRHLLREKQLVPRNRTVSANMCVVFKCTALARTNDREKKRLLNDTCYKQTPTRVVVWNRVTMKIEP